MNDLNHLVPYGGGNKAGMDENLEVSKSQQQKILASNNQNSAYIKHAMKLDKRTDERIAALLSRRKLLKSHDLNVARTRTNKKFEALEQKRSFGRHIVCLDMDAFYANVEIRDRPELADKPVSVGIGIVTTSNYIARKYGVRSGMPSYLARQCCPQLVQLEANMEKYKLVAAQLRDVIKDYDPHYSAGSLDEVLFDLTEYVEGKVKEKEREKNAASSSSAIASAPLVDNNSATPSLLFTSTEMSSSADTQHALEEDASPSSMVSIYNEAMRREVEKTVMEIRKRIFDATKGLTSSAGIANNAFMAKMCSNENKPNGQYSLALTKEGVYNFLRDAKLRKAGGIGRVFEKILKSLGITTLGDLREQMHVVSLLFKEKTLQYCYTACTGITDTEGQAKPVLDLHDGAVTRKSISVERTFLATADYNMMRSKLEEICNRLANDMQRGTKQLKAKTVTLKAKSSIYEVFNRSKTSSKYICAATEIFDIAVSLLTPLLPISVRLLGVRMSNFHSEVNAKTVVSNKKIDAFLVKSTSSKRSRNDKENTKSRKGKAEAGHDDDDDDEEEDEVDYLNPHYLEKYEEEREDVSVFAEDCDELLEEYFGSQDFEHFSNYESDHSGDESDAKTSRKKTKLDS
jgi:DNA polymerase kappa